MARDITDKQRRINERMFEIVDSIEAATKKAVKKLSAAYIYDETDGSLEEQVHDVMEACSRKVDDIRVGWLGYFSRGKKSYFVRGRKRIE